VEGLAAAVLTIALKKLLKILIYPKYGRKKAGNTRGEFGRQKSEWGNLNEFIAE
jgi:hypothetical protein